MIIREWKHVNGFLFESVTGKRISIAQRAKDFVDGGNLAE